MRNRYCPTDEPGSGERWGAAMAFHVQIMPMLRFVSARSRRGLGGFSGRSCYCHSRRRQCSRLCCLSLRELRTQLSRCPRRPPRPRGTAPGVLRIAPPRRVLRQLCFLFVFSEFIFRGLLLVLPPPPQRTLRLREKALENNANGSFVISLLSAQSPTRAARGHQHRHQLRRSKRNSPCVVEEHRVLVFLSVDTVGFGGGRGMDGYRRGPHLSRQVASPSPLMTLETWDPVTEWNLHIHIPQRRRQRCFTGNVRSAFRGVYT
ncbi:hypothetical protein F5148DRAFT_630207 [Russula earlei]|uniref:Uncharacterized protein n=1 Tax=Russula earlei TaxID=71964 RepID=A0ACC0UEI2_9AGAM|nr:hypothetical protein F5148DRAFT_630207 [Russula earlei]